MPTVNTPRSTRGRILDRLRTAAAVVSGERLSQAVGVSRVSVWKHVRGLQQSGYRIEAGPKGYRLADSRDTPFAWEFPGREDRIHYHETVDSTMTVSRTMARAGCPQGTVVVADRQTGGRGRLDRRWLSPPGGLYFTMVLRPKLPPLSALRLNFAASLEMARCLQQDYGVPARVKWPNDLLVDERKVAGMLAEMEAETDRVAYVNIGLGVNVNNSLPEGPALQAISLQQRLGRPVSRRRLLAAFLDRFEPRLNGDLASIMAEWKQVTATLGRQVRVETTDGTIRGLAEDLDDSGALLVRGSDGRLQQVLYGDCFHAPPGGETDNK